MEEITDIRTLNERISEESEIVTLLTRGMEETIIGQKHLTESLLIGLLADGHVLLEGVPGLAKTLAIKTLSSLIEAKFSRIQFTPDLLPADVTGTLIYSPRDENFKVKNGPIFANFVLADEINRAPAKVQSALLEAMQEKQVTLGDDSFPLPSPFMVLATQNPLEQEGTYVLPGYPTPEEEKKIVRAHIDGSFGKVTPVTDLAHLSKAREWVKKVYVDERITQYITDLVWATRAPENYGLAELKPYISVGASPRAGISLAVAGRALAFIRRRGYVVPEDIRSLAEDVLRHRISLTYEAEADEVKTDTIIHEVLNKIAVP